MITSIAVPAVSIIVAGLLAAWIASGSIKRLLAGRDRDLKVAAIGALVDAAEQASVWNSLTPQEQVLSDRATGQADIQVRLLPIKGAAVAANWATHSLAEMKRSSATFGYQVEPAVIVFRDQLVEWQNRPGRTRRSFQSDLDRWSTQGSDTERTLKEQQEAWVAQQHHEQHGAPAAQKQGATTAAAPTSAETSTVREAAPAAPVRQAPTYQAPTYPAHSTEAPRATTGTLDTARVLNDVDAVQRQIDNPAPR
ncbi:hypothetical protein [Subtercola boreus]|uniref:hypothetical protein n=1 Tax=Subtercola boreus TaxID=120213 RepID=UPI000E2FD9D4|nr:hypothetical protein [Subtercola boreus]